MAKVPYITLEAECALDSRWTAATFFAWVRLLSQCRLKRACTADTWPAAVLNLRTIEAAAILGVHPNKVRWAFDQLAIVASIDVRSDADRHGDRWTITVANYAKYQKLGRRSLTETSDRTFSPPHVPTSPRTEEERKTSPRAATPRRRATPRTERPAAFPSPELLADLVAEFADLDVPAAVDEFLAYADREEATYKGERGWSLALRGALLRDRTRGLFRRGPLRAVHDAPRGRPAYSADKWAAKIEAKEALERAAARAAQGRLLA